MPSRHTGNAIEPACGLLLVGHGSRERQGIDEFLATAALVAELTPMAVEPAFLEFAEPTIPRGFEALVRRGVARVGVVPALLFSAGHLQRDIPSAISVMAATYSDVVVEQAEHLGCHAALLELSQRRYDEALSINPPVSAESTGLVMVGRGSHDPQATAEMLRFVETRRHITPVASVCACFVAMADPPLERVLEQMTGKGLKQVVVQPHLLFGGVLVDRIRRTVEHFAQTHPEIQWVTTGHLGVSKCVAEAIFDRATSTPSGRFKRVVLCR